MKLTDRHSKAIHLLILDRGLRRDSTLMIAQQLGVKRSTLGVWRAAPEFQEEFQKQLRLYRQNFDDVPLADRIERVKALDEIFLGLPEKQAALKVKVLQAIRQEVGDDKQVLEVNHTGSIGIEAPPRAQSYEEWLQQNEVMDSVQVRAVPEAVEVLNASGVSVLPMSGPGTGV